MVTFLIIVLSLFFLVKSATVFVDQSSSLANKLNVNDYLIGLTVVAFGTSLPELTSTLISSASGHNQLVVSNIIGSNITNICLIFGVIALFNNLKISTRGIKVNIPLNISAIMIFWALSVFTSFTLTWLAGIFLIFIFIFSIFLSKEANHFADTNRRYVVFNPLILITALVILILSGKICIDQVIILASNLKISETILGYFILAIGTSLPELVVTLIAVKKYNGELGIGNILGSNLFNLLFILGASTFINPVSLDGFIPDLLFLTVATLAMYLFAVMGKKLLYSKNEAVGFLLIYSGFVIFQIFR